MNVVPDQIVEEARRKGPVAPSTYRVVVRESNAILGGREFASRDEAITYANDVASESDWPVPEAWVFDDTFCIVHQGTRYLG